MGKGGGIGGGRMGGKGGGSFHSRGRAAADMSRYRRQRGQNERFRSKKIERKRNRVIAQKTDEKEVLDSLVSGAGIFIAACATFLIAVYFYFR